MKRKTKKTSSHGPGNPKITDTTAPLVLRKGDMRKLEITLAAIDCLAHEGLAGATYEAIGKRAGIGKSHVIYHFPNWDEMIFAALEQVYSTGQQVVAEYMAADSTTKDFWARYIHGVVAWMEKYPNHAPAALLLAYQATVDPRFRKLQNRIREYGILRLQALLLETGFVASKPAALAKAKILQSVVFGLLAYAASSDNGPRLQEVPSLFLDVLKKI